MKTIYVVFPVYTKNAITSLMCQKQLYLAFYHKQLREFRVRSERREEIYFRVRSYEER